MAVLSNSRYKQAADYKQTGSHKLASTKRQTKKSLNNNLSANTKLSADTEKPVKSQIDSFGGQAVIEGVLMRGKQGYAIAIRKPDNKIKASYFPYKALSERNKAFSLPFLRGVAALYESLKIGIKALNYSAKEAGEDSEQRLSDFAVGLTLLLSFALSIVFFVALPYAITLVIGLREETRSILFNLVDGLVKAAIFVLYIYLISLMSDVRRIFQYHGAEHKAIHCYESGKKLTPENVSRFSRIHLRCGTSFLFLLIFVMVAVFSVIPSLIKLFFPAIASLSFIGQRAIYFSVRLFFIVPVAGISYEVLKLTDRMKGSFIAAIISYPGALIQKLTTKEPDKSQIEVAIAALKAAIKGKGTP